MKYIFFFAWILLSSCNQTNKTESQRKEEVSTIPEQPFLIVLGTVQDAGSPHAGCKKDCCKNLFKNPDPTRLVTALGLVDPIEGKTFLIEASPDLPSQMKTLTQMVNAKKETPEGIFITHGHIGHYTGLMYLGRESMNANQVPVYLMPRMKTFIAQNGPWDQLVTLQNIQPRLLHHQTPVVLTEQVTITPFLVPHRDEYSETVGFYIQGQNKNALFIPDIDKWNKWDQSIVAWIEKVDYAFLDATFYDGQEVNNRDISEIPHPFVIESMALFKDLPVDQKAKVYFIHLNHTNPLLDTTSLEYKKVIEKGYNVAAYGKAIPL